MTLTASYLDTATPVPASAHVNAPGSLYVKSYFTRVGLATIVIPILMVFMLAVVNGGSTTTEFLGTVASMTAASVCWAVAGWLFIVRVYGRRFFAVVTVVLLIKVVTNLIHFYFVFSPLAGITSSAQLPVANFTGDSGLIFLSAEKFYETYAGSGLWYAILGDYYRGINNPGVAIIFGGLFTVFGAYASTAIPWIALYSVFGAIIVGMFGRAVGLSFQACKAAVLIVLFMPGFFVFPPLYRDNLLIFLLALSAYTALLLRQGNVWWLGSALLIQGILLFSLRSVYLIVPPMFGLTAIYFESHTKARFLKRLALFSCVVAIVIAMTWSNLVLYLDLFAARFAAALTSDLSDFSILGPFKAIGPVVFYFAAAIFSLLAPMPWWQSAPPPLLSFQVFSYAQTWWALTVFAALFFAYRRRLLSRGGSMLVIFFFMIFGLAVFGSLNFQASYYQIAMPFLVLASLPYLQTHWKACFRISTLVVVLVHVALLTI